MESAGLTPHEIVGLLADQDRLRVVAAIVLGAGTPAEIADAAALSPRAAGKALGRLTSGGLVDGDAASGYRLRADLLRAAATADAKPEPGPAAAIGEDALVLGRFIRGGRLVAIPTGRAKRLAVLNHLAGMFEPGIRYTEAEVNELLRRWHPDHASLRRYLVDEGFLERADERDPASGRTRKVYWRVGGSFEVDS